MVSNRISVFVLALAMFMPVIALASGYSSSGVSLPVSALNGGTANTTGAGLVGGTSSANDTSGTVTLTAASAHTRFFSQGASTLTYELPACTGEARGLWVFRSTGTGTGDVTLDPAAGDAIGGLSANTNFVISATMTTNTYWVLFCDGVANWVWIKEPTQTITYQAAGMLMTGSGGVITSSGAPTGQLLSANNMTSATSLTAVGALATGSIASGFGTIVTANNHTGSDFTATTGSFVCSAAGQGVHVTDAANSLAGQGTLVNGVATISTTAIDADDVVHITRTGGTLTTAGVLWEVKASRSAGTSFVVNSYYPVTAGGTTASATDDATFDWVIQKVD